MCTVWDALSVSKIVPMAKQTLAEDPGNKFHVYESFFFT